MTDHKISIDLQNDFLADRFDAKHWVNNMTDSIVASATDADVDKHLDSQVSELIVNLQLAAAEVNAQ